MSNLQAELSTHQERESEYQTAFVKILQKIGAKCVGIVSIEINRTFRPPVVEISALYKYPGIETSHWIYYLPRTKRLTVFDQKAAGKLKVLISKDYSSKKNSYSFKGINLMNLINKI